MIRMSKIQSKVTCHAMNGEDLKLNENRQPTDSNTEMIEMAQLSDKDFKVKMVNGKNPSTSNYKHP